MITPLLSASDLHVFYGAIHALKGIRFYVNAGEIVSLIGGNGAGKTTTLRGISGLIESQGKLEFKGENISELPAHQRVQMGIAQCPEGRGVFPQMSIFENLQLGAYLRSDKAQIKADLEMCFALFPRLKERSKQLAGTLSGGEQQMLAICRALMSKPQLLLLDEPSMGLAPLIVAQIFEIIQNLNKNGMTVLLVEQNASLALKISHRAYVLETGSLVLEGRGADLLVNPDVQKAYLGI